MEAPVLTRAEQKAAIGKKRKKRVLKNVLGVPKYLKVESQIAEDLEAKKLKYILERLLPSARLPISQNFKSKETTKPTEEEKLMKETAMVKRRQLSLGVNDLNKSIKKGLISAALFASDVEPKFLIHHLNLLCSHNKIPHLHINHLREITRNCLGFPCIAVGFKTNSEFLDVINEIKAISEKKEMNKECDESETEMTDNECVSEQEENKTMNTKSEEPPFTYLYRTSTKERVFIPEKQNNKTTDEFISVDKSEDSKVENVASGISTHLIKKKSQEIAKSDKDSSSDEDYEIPRKKQKKNWFNDKTSSKEKPKYHPVNLIKVSSNPNRIARKRKV